ncbi:MULTISPECIES: sulfite exporter TauE/SafE family protein [unclassified Oleiphilus]|uniref:sulfite exporter TauE/SafE family protein n=1 Tax=unclassified Oleiphilus TaxID=2631174 RepID=UPI0007C36F9B|nr:MULTISPECIES: sulfite exporter TauE/SafE family protein [unclassified Oleiphilus]KZY49968.1 hypothetical protein A3732_00545 [Oleiphilus sp. HI0050]KZZ35981.1 hypothetical protein A3756_14145 [Oleiphilus sp. HI0086]KZZ40291.1 hypothetical protein A3757_00035 [Oleiphilus sp. HI0117]KZZ54200.1 hypothetical protein A3761_14935 [Oleiphilus sp. HI0123]
MFIVSYLLAGIFAGLTAGLFGVGGGLVVVPILVFVFESQGFPAEVLTHMAIATSLATIVFTSMSSVYNHHKRGAVLWSVFRPMSAGIALGAVLGVLTLVQLDGWMLKKLFGLFAVIVALRMFIKSASLQSLAIPGNIALSIMGVVIAWFSSIFGIGGGTLSVPYLSRYRIEMKEVVGTAAACGLPIALFATLSNVMMGSDLQGRPEWSLGLIYLPALLGISICSVYFARVGTQLAHRLSPLLLKRLFAGFLLLIGVRFLVT